MWKGIGGPAGKGQSQPGREFSILGHSEMGRQEEVVSELALHCQRSEGNNYISSTTASCQDSS